jgi:hypothetical protein
MAINNVLNNSLSGQTGSGAFVGSVSPTLDQITFSPDIQGIVGATSGSHVSAGYVGEVINSIVLATAPITGIPNNTPFNITSIPVTAGRWLIYGLMGTYAAGTSTLIAASGAASLVSATLPDFAFTSSANDTLTDGRVNLPIASTVYFFSTTTTVYLVCASNYTGSAIGYGFIEALRVA